MFNEIMNLVDSLESRYYVDMCDNIIENTENKYNIMIAIDPIAIDPITIACSGLTIAAGGVLNFENGEQVATILLDETYLGMDEEHKRFVIAHELGHLVYQIEKFKAGNYVRNIEDEFEADEYAMEQVGLEVTIEALNEIKSILKEMCTPEEYLNEIDERIENLLNKNMVLC